MADPAVPAVEGLGVDTVELPHALGEVALHRFHHDMVMVAHLAPGVADPVAAPADCAEDLQPEPAVLFVQIDILPPLPPGGDIGEPAGQFYA
jgi:hypothetical protein